VLYLVLVASEIAFWSLLVGGLFVRYALERTALSTALLLAAASTDVVVLLVAMGDLAAGTAAQTSHLIAVIAFAYSVVYARRLVGIADRFVLRRLGRPVAEPPRASRAEREREGWYRHARMWVLGAPLLGFGYLMAADGDALIAGAGIWTVILAIDFIVSFSYSLGERCTNPGH
jgi:hypothetical protein